MRDISRASVLRGIRRSDGDPSDMGLWHAILCYNMVLLLNSELFITKLCHQFIISTNSCRKPSLVRFNTAEGTVPTRNCRSVSRITKQNPTNVERVRHLLYYMYSYIISSHLKYTHLARFPGRASLAYCYNFRT